MNPLYICSAYIFAIGSATHAGWPCTGRTLVGPAPGRRGCSWGRRRSWRLRRTRRRCRRGRWAGQGRCSRGSQCTGPKLSKQHTKCVFCFLGEMVFCSIYCTSSHQLQSKEGGDEKGLHAKGFFSCGCLYVNGYFFTVDLPVPHGGPFIPWVM